ARAAAQWFVAVAGDTLPGGWTGSAQLAAALAVVGTRVLGQYDPYGSPRLVLVAPNLVEVSRQMPAPRSQFALWVCVHEQTHALQFAAAPWLADHLRGEAQALLGSLQTPGKELE
ncbi:MAG TPA: zinc-dependent metalloprotease, partial [Actinotalea sp.]|nr:zinc-dependent metalloprotease [Actinotalea sp.]